MSRRTGLAVQGRCGATNLCEYCRGVYLRETATIVKLGAERWPPTVYQVLTAREHLARDDCRRALEHLLRAARRRWLAVEWFVACELQKRGALHLNLLVRGVPPESAGEFGALAAKLWCARFDARPVAQNSQPIRDAAGVADYVSKFSGYVTKASQQPAIGWTGHRTSQTRGFWPCGAATLREQARWHAVWLMHFGAALDAGLRGLAARSWATNAGALDRLYGWALVDVTAPNAPWNQRPSGRRRVAAAADERAENGPAATVKRYVDDERAQGRLFSPETYRLKNRGPHTETS